MSSTRSGTVHVVGAGVAGLAAAVELAGAGRRVVVHEATAQPGGRCRSYHDKSTGMVIDNGTHLILSGNRSVLSFAETIGSREGLFGPEGAAFPFFDLTTRESWALEMNDGRIPWWVFDKSRRAPQTSAADYLSLAKLLWMSADRPVREVVDCSSPMFERSVGPLLLAALNIDPGEGSAKLAGAVLRESVAAGGSACKPLLAHHGIGKVLVEPAATYLHERGVDLLLDDELIGVEFAQDRVTRLAFRQATIALGKDDAVILAVPPYVATRLVPDICAPSAFRGIVNAHFRIDPPARMPAFLGVINGTCEWIFSLPGRISVTVSDADRLFDLPRLELAECLWREVAMIAELPDRLPPWQIVRERRATFEATPAQNALRPSAETAWQNLMLAGDWIQTGLPATLEGAVRSGYRAAALLERPVRAAA